MKKRKVKGLETLKSRYGYIFLAPWIVGLAEGIRQAVSEYQTLSVTVSIGVAEHHDGETVEQLFSRVDKALYAAKNDGRNRVSRMPFENVELLHSRGGAA